MQHFPNEVLKLMVSTIDMHAHIPVFCAFCVCPVVQYLFAT